MTQFKAFKETTQELNTMRMIANLSCASDCRGALRHCKETGPGTRYAHMVASAIRHTSNAIGYAAR